MVKRLWAWLWLLSVCAAPTLWAGDIEVTVEPNPPHANESFTLTFTTHGPVDAEPDFAPLEAQLEIISRNRQTSIQWVNGDHAQATNWVLNVMAKQGGPLTIPAISFGNQQSPPKQIVLDAATDPAAAQVNDDLFLEAKAEPQSPYVQQQIIYTMQLWRRVDIGDATLSEPKVSGDAVIKRLGKDREFQASRDGKQYEVFERRYALFPQQSGHLGVEPVALTAQVFKRSRSVFDLFGQTATTRRIQSTAVNLDVKPIPASFPGKVWLPAKRLRLQEDWDPEQKQVRAGEPITRSLNLWADGLTAGQLPEIPAPLPENTKSYPDQPQTSDQETATGFTAVRQQKTAIIPAAEGSLQLPQVELPWWNTETDSLELAILPATTIIATAAVPQAPLDSGIEATPVTSPPAQPQTAAPVNVRSNLWFWVAIACAAGWLLTVGILLLRSRRKRPASLPAQVPVRAPTARLERDLKAACEANDPSGAKAALLAWARAQYTQSNLRSLADLQPLVSADLARELQQLQATLYGNAHGSWTGGDLWTRFSALDRAATAGREPPTPPLEPLFKLTS